MSSDKDIKDIQLFHLASGLTKIVIVTSLILWYAVSVSCSGQCHCSGYIERCHELQPTSGVCLEQVTNFRSEAACALIGPDRSRDLNTGLWLALIQITQDICILLCSVSRHPLIISLILQTFSRTGTLNNWLQLKRNFINCLLPSLLTTTHLNLTPMHPTFKSP